MNNIHRGLPLARVRIEQIFPKLTSTQIRRITPHGRTRTTKRGEVLSEQGDIALEQIKRFKLPSIPDSPETLDKLRKDTRTNKFREKHGGKLYAVELDALLAVVPDQFKTLVQLSVDQFFDKNIYKEVLRAHLPEHIDRLVHKKVKFLD